MPLKRRPRSLPLSVTWRLPMPGAKELVMTDRCKLGDVAIIIKDNPGCEANIGRVVRVHGPRRVFPRRGTVWRITPVAGTTMTYVDYDRTVAVGLACEIEHEDDWLLPIRPEADDDAISVHHAKPVTNETEVV
jgi:hypothetical protein